VQEWIEATGGAEKVASSISSVFPNAPIYTLWNDGGEDWSRKRIIESGLSRTFLRGHKAAALPLMPLTWRSWRNTGFDIVISSSHLFAHTFKFRKDPSGVRYYSYVHTPARYIWNPELDARGKIPIMTAARNTLKFFDRTAGGHVCSIAANSVEVSKRIAKYWNRESVVIHPPVDTAFFVPRPSTVPPFGGEYLLGVGRWVRYKRFDLILALAEKVGLPAIIAGCGPEESRLRTQANSMAVPVQFVTQPSNAMLRNLFTDAVALVYPTHEDFGIVPIEAQACGTPILGINQGGLKETVIPGVTGQLADSTSISDLIDAFNHIPTPEISTMRSHVDQFSSNRFNSRIQKWINTQPPTL
jgi:glycosyltransferase involved in cell wall biosynthesis